MIKNLEQESIKLYEKDIESTAIMLIISVSADQNHCTETNLFKDMGRCSITRLPS